MSYAGGTHANDNYGLAEDVAVYSFDSLGDDHDLGALLDDGGLDDFNDETFGASGGVTGAGATAGRDFDFAGNTARYLDKPLQSLDSTWLSGPSSASSTTTTTTTTTTNAANKTTSAWNSLDNDDLLSTAYKPSTISASHPTAQRAAAPPSASAGRQMRTLEEIEAEMRNQKPSPSSNAPASKPLTLEELEAEMLRKARSQQPQAPVSSSPLVQSAPQAPQQQQQHQQQPFPPLNGNGQPMPFYGQFPPPGVPQPSFPFDPRFAPPFQGGNRPPFPPPLLGPNGMPLPYPPPPPPHMMSPPPPIPHVGQGSPIVQAQQIQRGSTPIVPTGPGSMMNTLFPPLPSQIIATNRNSGGGLGQADRKNELAQVEEKLQFLNMNQHAQHPSLTSAQLQAILQQAQAVTQSNGSIKVEKKVEEGEGRVEHDEDEEEKKKQAGEELIRTVEKRIMEHEMIEHKRKRKAMKIASMAKHNNLMSNSDKDFITRIQVSQLVTDDPYADDFYFHIMAAIKMSRHQAALAAGVIPGGVMPPPSAMLGMGAGGAVAPGRIGTPQNNGGGANRRPTRRENAMNRMAQNVQRLVDSAKQRNKSGQLSLDGALGKIALRTRSAPRQLLQVKADATTSTSKPSTGSHLLEGLVTSSNDGKTSSSLKSDKNSDGKPLSHRAVLSILEKIYDAVLDLEQLRRLQPQLLGSAAAAKERLEIGSGAAPEIVEQLEKGVEETSKAVEEWDFKYGELTDRLWNELRVMKPLDKCVPHPFVALISVLKGKRILPRALRHLSPEQTLTLLTLIVATFDTLDTVRDAPILDSIDETAGVEGKQRRIMVETKTEAFLNAILAPVMTVIGQAPLRMVTGMLGLLMERNDLTKVVQSKPGIAFLTIFLSRAESLKQANPAPEAQDLQAWQRTFDHLFNSLINQQLPKLFASSRAQANLPFGAAAYLSTRLDSIRPDIDRDDEPVWRLLAAVAVCAEANEQEMLVTSVRDKVLENVTSAKKSRVAPEIAALKIRNVNLLLHSLGLDASQLTVDE